MSPSEVTFINRIQCHLWANEILAEKKTLMKWIYLVIYLTQVRKQNINIDEILYLRTNKLLPETDKC